MAHLAKRGAVRRHRRFRLAVVLPLWLAVLAGCAGTHWERALYEGMRSGHPDCARDTAARRRTCEPLPAYEDYARERERVRTSPP